MQVPNESPIAASASSDMYGAAVLDACVQIKARMEPVSKHNFSSFAEVDLFSWFLHKIFGFPPFYACKLICLVSDFHTMSVNPANDVGQVPVISFHDFCFWPYIFLEFIVHLSWWMILSTVLMPWSKTTQNLCI